MENITVADYADDLVLLANIFAPAESQLQSPEQAARDIGLYMNHIKQILCVLNKIKRSPH